MPAEGDNDHQVRLPGRCRTTPGPDRFAVRLAKGAILVYVAGLLLWAIARPIAGDQSVFVFSLSCLGVWLFSPLLIAGPWAFLGQQRFTATLLVIPAALFLRFYGSLFLPRSAPPEPRVAFSVLTLNVYYMNTNTRALGAALIASQADVLALQEVTNLHREYLDSALDAVYPYHFHHVPAGLAIYSRFPFLEEDVLSRDIQRVIVQVEGRTVQLINAHLSQVGIFLFLRTWDTSLVQDLVAARESQIAQIEAALPRTGLPAIVACDCNMTDLMMAYEQATAILQDAHQERGWGPGHTFLIPQGFEMPSAINLPVQRIDYLLHSPEIGVTKIEVLPGTTGSDHLPLMAQFDLDP